MLNIKKQISRLYASNQMVIFRLCSGISTLCAGFALFIGRKLAYGADILIGIVQIWNLSSLCEAGIRQHDGCSEKSMMASIGKELMTCFITSISFLKNARKASFLMFCNSLVGAVDILLLFFLQAKLPRTNMPNLVLGFALSFMEMGGILGAKIILKCKRMR